MFKVGDTVKVRTNLISYHCYDTGYNGKKVAFDEPMRQYMGKEFVISMINEKGIIKLSGVGRQRSRDMFECKKDKFYLDI